MSLNYTQIYPGDPDIKFDTWIYHFNSTQIRGKAAAGIVTSHVKFPLLRGDLLNTALCVGHMVTKRTIVLCSVPMIKHFGHSIQS